MVATLGGRIQTRIAVLLVVGGLWILLITPLLPGVDTNDLSAGYHATYAVLIAVIVFGIGWEFIYHGIQQFRWEKDWPTMFGLLTAINEGLLIWIFVRTNNIPSGVHIPQDAFWIAFVTTWLLTWMVVNGPMRVPFIRWRFRGGRVIG